MNNITYRLPQRLSGKESACNARDAGAKGLITGSGRSPGGGHGNPLQYSCLENPTDRGARWAEVHGVAESDTTDATKHSTILNTEHRYPSVRPAGALGLFPLLAVVSEAAVNTGVQVSLWHHAFVSASFLLLAKQQSIVWRRHFVCGFVTRWAFELSPLVAVVNGAAVTAASFTWTCFHYSWVFACVVFPHAPQRFSATTWASHTFDAVPALSSWSPRQPRGNRLRPAGLSLPAPWDASHRSRLSPVPLTDWVWVPGPQTSSLGLINFPEWCTELRETLY